MDKPLLETVHRRLVCFFLHLNVFPYKETVNSAYDSWEKGEIKLIGLKYSRKHHNYRSQLETGKENLSLKYSMALFTGLQRDGTIYFRILY